MRIVRLIILLIPFLYNITSQSCDTSCGCEEVNPCCVLQDNECGVFGKSVYVGRSQGNNLARKEFAIAEYTHLWDVCKFYGVAQVTFEYQQTFNNNKLANWFSPNGSSVMTYGLDYETNEVGSGFFNINALNFGVTSSGTISFSPKKTDFITDIYLYVGFDAFIPLFWMSIDAPIVHTTWDLHLKDCLTTMSTSSIYPANSVGAGDIDVVFNSQTPMLDAFKGKVGFGDAPQLEFGRICGERSDTTVANLRFDIGYDFIRCPHYYFAASVDFSTAISTQPDATYLFDAMVGNYARWQAGVFAIFAYNFWQNCDQDKQATFVLAANVDHVYGKTQQRLLGLNIPGVTEQEKNWSYYLLLKKFNSSNQAIGLERAANILAGNVKVKANAEVNLLAEFEFKLCSYLMGFGYEFWCRTQEQITCRYFTILDHTYAIKGSTQWNGLPTDTANNLVSPTTTISKNGPVQEVTVAGSYLNGDSFWYCPAIHPSAYSNKIFGYAGKEWQNCDWMPFLIMAAEVEFGQSNRTWSQWGVMAKAGIAF